MTGGSGNDLIFGQAGDDTLLGNGGIDQIFGGAGNDVLSGGTGNDSVFGENDNDRMIWNPGDGTDLNEGGAGIDTVEINGGNGAETFTVTANGTRVRFDRTTPAPFSLDIGTTENLLLNANGGDDVVSAGNGLAPLISLTVDGGAGNDLITGGDGNDTLLGGDGNDTIIGGRGNDTAFLGNGDDTFVWNPGDGSDTVEGQAGNDSMIFNGANVNEKIDLSANGNRLRLTRDVANVTMDTNDVENININALGGADTVTANDLSATSVSQLSINLAASTGSGDASADSVIVNGTANTDNVQLSGNGSSYTVAGLSTVVTVAGSEGSLDALTVNLLGGTDSFDASAMPANIARLTVDGGTDDDIIVASQGDDVILGGDGNDLITGGRGNDTAFMGDSNDTFVWNPGDGSDIVEGQAGSDTLLFNGANVNENFDLSANGSRVRLTRDVADITMDLNGLEQINLYALGGADTITVNDLTGTGLGTINLNLAASVGGGDGQADNVIINGTNGNDNIVVASSVSGGVNIGGLSAVVKLMAPEATLDRLTINALGGSDTVNASALGDGAINLSENGGAGDDVLTGSQGNDVVSGGTGNDVALLGAGDDTFVWNPGDGSDTVEGQSGNDTMIFNGANVNENINISANGSRVRLTRDVANITMDLNSIEQINLSVLGGADNITLNDLSGTGVTQINLDLGSPPGSGTGDGQADTVVINATNGNDAVSVASDTSGVAILGLAASVHINGAEAANDRLLINALGGDDTVDASALSATAIQLTEDGGDGDDVLVGGAGNDTLLGGIGDDVLLGGPGQDILDGGPGSNIIIPD